MGIENLEELKAIINNAPDGLATDFTLRFGRVKYYKFSPHGCWYYFEGNNWIPIERPQRSTRSLSDIKRIIEMMEATQGLLQLTAGSPDGYWRNEINAARKALGLKV